MEELERRTGVDRRQHERRKYDRRSEDQSPHYKQLEYDLRCKNKEIQKLKDEIHEINSSIFGC